MHYFTACGWEWNYEPIDTPGGWIPDFSLHVPGHPPCLVECKPALSPEQLAPAQAKAERSGWRGEVLLLGASPAVALSAQLTGDGVLALWLPPQWWPPLTGLLRLAWATAVNRTQWRPRRR